LGMIQPDSILRKVIYGQKESERTNVLLLQ
jgi:hypothetical protein